MSSRNSVCVSSTNWFFHMINSSFFPFYNVLFKLFFFASRINEFRNWKKTFSCLKTRAVLCTSYWRRLEISKLLLLRITLHWNSTCQLQLLSLKIVENSCWLVDFLSLLVTSSCALNLIKCCDWFPSFRQLRSKWKECQMLLLKNCRFNLLRRKRMLLRKSRKKK